MCRHWCHKVLALASQLPSGLYTGPFDKNMHGQSHKDECNKNDEDHNPEIRIGRQCKLPERTDGQYAVQDNALHEIDAVTELAPDLRKMIMIAMKAVTRYTGASLKSLLLIRSAKSSRPCSPDLAPKQYPVITKKQETLYCPARVSNLDGGAAHSSVLTK
jgi:hypothetical protein